MLPIVQLRQVTREDVHRISRWLMDQEIASSWFGHYACGDPIHRGYEPRLMLRASPEDWTRVFDRNRSHLVFSIYAGAEGHIGECQAVFDTHGDVEMSLLIGRKDLWQRGFGASAAIQLLDRVFYDYNVEQAWVSIPQENVAAQRLFVRLGFTPVSDYSECHAPEGGRLRATTLALPASDYYNRRVQPAQGAGAAPPIVTVTGLPGSGSENVASETARLIRARFVDDAKMTDALAAQLNRTTGEIHALESGYASFWTRALRAMLAPWERYGTMDASAEFMYTFQNVDFPDHLEYLTKEEYIEGLDSTVSSLVAGGPTVLHGFGARRFLPKGRPTFNVFVDMPLEIRVRKALMEHEVSPDQARRALKRADKEFASIYKNLLGIDTLDPGQYDITISMSRLTVEAAARMVSGAVVRSASRRAAQRPQTAILQPV